MNDRWGKMKERLKVNIWRKKNVVIAEIVEQDESLRGAGVIEKNNAGFSIMSTYDQTVIGNTLLIRGRNRGDDKGVTCQWFKNDSLAIEWCANIKELINKINSVEVEEEEEDNDGFVRVM